MRVSATPLRAAAAAMALGLAATGCVGAGADDSSVLTLGYFPNITHAPALVGVENGTLDEALGEVELATQTFNAGPDAINAVFSGEIDAAFVGPNPAINGWAQSRGEALHVIAGAATQGAGLVARDDIRTVDDLPGKTLSTPMLGGTQDVVLRWFALDRGWEVDTAGGGDLSIVPQENPEIVNAFRAGEIDGAWLPEPHLSRLLAEDDAHLLVDEREVWERTGGQYVTTLLIVNADFLEREPEVVENLLRGHVETVGWMNDNPEEAAEASRVHLEEITGGGLDPELTAAAFDNVLFTVDPVAESLLIKAEQAEAIGLLDPVDLDGIYALDPLNDVLAQAGHEPVAGLEG
ncbi:ABC transporter substrate-binding protein [Nocardiopsis metallicus]|uniref:NitT/TauT family transport system substrate-binding protein n=1 Tax=Nocardiopsis metallicus TaxID=179819 RepID=A0A840VYE3_9ACTN|nr:ABC transporter substrate-binding protein [Nocardiopsis metallicus]MBB5489510.1 NitT/TauT family transport system substrate-binding protein [Nocardiopsis metallicus]